MTRVTLGGPLSSYNMQIEPSNRISSRSGRCFVFPITKICAFSLYTFVLSLNNAPLRYIYEAMVAFYLRFVSLPLKSFSEALVELSHRIFPIDPLAFCSDQFLIVIKYLFHN
jgi:hypothetical protein